MPQRIQRKRTKGWRMPEGAVYVGRPSGWGNPFTIPMMQERIEAVRPLAEASGEALPSARELAVEAFESVLRHGPDSNWWWMDTCGRMIDINLSLPLLRGHDLACWCPLDQPCHADVLLELANGGA